MAGSVDGEITSQAIGATHTSTGAKIFGAGQIPMFGNPNYVPRDNWLMLGVVVVGLVAAYSFTKRKD